MPKLFHPDQPNVDELTLTIAPEKRSLQDAIQLEYDIPQLQMDQLHHVSSIVAQILAIPSRSDDISFPKDKPLTDSELLYLATDFIGIVNKITEKAKITRRKIMLGNPKEKEE